MINGLLVARKGTKRFFALTVHCNAHFLHKAVNLLRLSPDTALAYTGCQWVDFMKERGIGCSVEGCRNYENNLKIIEWLELHKSDFDYYHDVDLDRVKEE